MKNDKNTLKQLMNIKIVLLNLKSQGITKISINELQKYFTEEEIKLLIEVRNFKFVDKSDTKNKETEKIVEEMLNLLTETPYTILKIENKDFDKEELLEIVKKRIAEINSLDYDRAERRNKIDKVLDAYNKIIKDKKGKTKQLIRWVKYE